MGSERDQINANVKVNYNGKEYINEKNVFDLDDITRDQLDEVVNAMFLDVLEDAKNKRIYNMHRPKFAENYAPGAQLKDLIENYPDQIKKWEVSTGNRVMFGEPARLSENDYKVIAHHLVYYYEVAKKNTLESRPVVLGAVFSFPQDVTPQPTRSSNFFEVETKSEVQSIASVRTVEDTNNNPTTNIFEIGKKNAERQPVVSNADSIPSQSINIKYSSNPRIKGYMGDIRVIYEGKEYIKPSPYQQELNGEYVRTPHRLASEDAEKVNQVIFQGIDFDFDEEELDTPVTYLRNLIVKNPDVVNQWKDEQKKLGNDLDEKWTLDREEHASKLTTPQEAFNLQAFAYHIAFYAQVALAKNPEKFPEKTKELPAREVEIQSAESTITSSNVNQNAPRKIKRGDIIGDVNIVYNNKEYSKEDEYLNLDDVTYEQLKSVIETVFANDFELLESRSDGYYEAYAKAQPGQQLVSLVRNFPEKIQEWQDQTGNHFDHTAQYKKQYNSNVVDQITAHNLVFYTEVSKDPQKYIDFAKDIPLNKTAVESPVDVVSDVQRNEQKPMVDEITSTKIVEVIEPVIKPVESHTTEAILKVLQNDDMSVTDTQTIAVETTSTHDVRENLTTSQPAQNDVPSTPVIDVQQTQVDNSPTFINSIDNTSNNESEAKLRQQLETLITTKKLDLSIPDNLVHWQKQVSWRGLGGGVEVQDAYGNTLKDENNKPYKVPHAVARMNTAVQDWKQGRSETKNCINQLAEAVEKANSRYTFFQPTTFNTRKEETQNTYDAVKDLNTQVSMKK